MLLAFYSLLGVSVISFEVIRVAQGMQSFLLPFGSFQGAAEEGAVEQQKLHNTFYSLLGVSSIWRERSSS